MERGQASVETVVLLPVLLTVALACWQALLVGWTSICAEHAARAAARAALVGDEPRAAAARSLPGVMRSGLRVAVADGTVVVRVHVPAVVPGLDVELSADARLARQ
jgi:hypothetical protein